MGIVVRQPAEIRLEDPVTRVKGIGPARATALAGAGIQTVEDLLLYLPFRYEDRSAVVPVASLRGGERCVVRVSVERARLVRRGRDSRVEATVSDESGSISAVWFRQPYIANTVEPGARLWLFGKVTRHEEVPQLVNPVVEPLEEPEEEGADPAGLHVGRLVPIYRRIGVMSPGVLRRVIDTALSGLAEPAESVPRQSIRRLVLAGRGEALRAIHRPPADADPDQWSAARSAAHRRLVCEEFLVFQTALRMQRPEHAGAEAGIRIAATPESLGEVLGFLPFDLTDGQRGALDQALADMESGRTMHRLLQGDVGCGKTAVAGSALLVTAHAGRQAALMAPTEILARQHAANLTPWARSQGRVLECLTGSSSAADRKRILAGLAAGEVEIVVGTHALIETSVEFKRLGLAVVDEQHRFGVRQRAALRLKGTGREGRWPHLLVMTATPIPRSLALTVYGDLDICTIEDMPPGRRPVKTQLCGAADWRNVIEVLLQTAERGEQAYVVAPRIEAGDDELAAAVQLEAELRRQLPGVRVGLMHGAQAAEKRMLTMREFIEGEIDVLAATTVIEVGVDVPNATLMVVGHAEKFGLAQLHQLRGRVGRGPAASTCIFIGHEPLSAAAAARLRAVRETDDGFVLAEKDLQLRGPGELLGIRQAGVAGLRVGDPFHDHEWLEAAREEARLLVRADDPESVAFRDRATEYWRRRFVAVRAG